MTHRTPYPIPEDRLGILEDLVLTTGNHEKGSGYCYNEALAYLAGEKHSDHPKCVDETITTMTMRYNDRCGEGEEANARRMRLFRETYLLVLGTRGSKALAARRAYMGADWSWRTALPALLRCTDSMKDWAERLEQLPAIVDEQTRGHARRIVYAMRDEAWLQRSEAWGRFYASRLAIWALAAAVAADAAAALAAAVDAAAAAVAAAADADADAAAAAALAAAVAAAAAADADDDADAAVVAVAAVAAVADAAAAAADAVAAATAVAAVAAAAVAVAAVADAADTADTAEKFRRILDAAKQMHDSGGDRHACYLAARKVADEVMAETIRSRFRHLRDQLDGEFIALVKRMALTEGAER